MPNSVCKSRKPLAVDINGVLDYESDNLYTGSFSNLNSNSEIEYFITATNLTGNSVSNPIAGWHVFNTLETILGDINQDNFINIQDIILVLNLALNNEYNNLADFNLDQIIDILDIIQLVNFILNN